MEKSDSRALKLRIFQSFFLVTCWKWLENSVPWNPQPSFLRGYSYPCFGLKTFMFHGFGGPKVVTYNGCFNHIIFINFLSEGRWKIGAFQVGGYRQCLTFLINPLKESSLGPGALPQTQPTNLNHLTICSFHLYFFEQETWRIHGTNGIFTYTYQYNQPFIHVGKYQSHGSYELWPTLRLFLERVGIFPLKGVWRLDKGFRLPMGIWDYQTMQMYGDFEGFPLCMI